MAIVNQNILSSQTVFVLGAGASKPYGFPLGSELKIIMLARLKDGGSKNILMSAGFNKTIIGDFHEALGYSYHSTIDIFLEKKTRFRDIGSYVIALSLIPFENSISLFPQHDWYGELFNLLDFENGGNGLPYPSFVSLNYDRSLEHFLNMNIEYNCKDEKLELCHKENQKIKIVHAHGSLGSYPDVPYGLDANDPVVLKKAAKRITIVSDRLDDSSDFQEAEQVISQASNIVFFGFGYDEITLSKLLSESDINSKKFIGTDVGLSANTRTLLQNKFGDKLIIGNSVDCKHLLEEIRMAMS